jgi:hypothetical protein
MEYRRQGFAPGETVSMGALSVRAVIFGGLVTFVAAGLAQAQAPQRPPVTCGSAQTQQRLPVGGIGSPPDAMIFSFMSRAVLPAHAGRAARNGLPPKAPFNSTPTSG